jgi:hypothetical protein
MIYRLLYLVYYEKILTHNIWDKEIINYLSIQSNSYPPITLQLLST